MPPTPLQPGQKSSLPWDSPFNPAAYDEHGVFTPTNPAAFDGHGLLIAKRPLTPAQRAALAQPWTFGETVTAAPALSALASAGKSTANSSSMGGAQHVGLLIAGGIATVAAIALIAMKVGRKAVPHLAAST